MTGDLLTNLRTYHRKSFWNTPSPAMQNSEHNALRRDLVVLDCQPPSKIVSEVSSTRAILLPCRYTVETPSLVTTSVFPDFQFLFAWMALHICCSILRMRVGVVLTLIQLHKKARVATNSRQFNNCHSIHRPRV